MKGGLSGVSLGGELLPRERGRQNSIMHRGPAHQAPLWLLDAESGSAQAPELTWDVWRTPAGAREAPVSTSGDSKFEGLAPQVKQ